MIDYSGVYFGGGKYYCTNQTLPLSDEEVAYKEQLSKTVFKNRGRRVVKICLVCGRYFTSDGIPIRICSATCKVKRIKLNNLQRHKRYEEKNKEKIKIRQKAYRELHKEKMREYGKAYRETNKEILKQRALDYRETFSEYQRKRYAKNRDAKKFFEALAMADAISNYDVDK